MKINIAIDGPSAAGKSTLAKKLSEKLGYTHLDTGAMYRAVALIVLREHLDVTDEERVCNRVAKSNFYFNSLGHIVLDGEDVASYIRTNEIDLLTSAVAKHPKVRSIMVKIQQEIAKEKGYVLDGRDIGSVVLPEAELKVFQTASIESRAKRRLEEYQQRGLSARFEDLYNEIKLRDENDTQRASSPLLKTEDAIELDTSNLSIDEMVDVIYKEALKKMEVKR